MTPKEKVKELYDKFNPHVLLKDFFNNDVEHKVTIKCVIIAIKNEYHSNRELLFNLRSCGVIKNEKVYLSRLQGLIDEEKNLIKEIEDLEPA